MQLQTFKAETIAAALAQVKSTMGHDAVILHTRSFTTRRWLGLRRQEVFEITAGKGVSVPSRPPARKEAKAAAPPQPTLFPPGAYARTGAIARVAPNAAPARTNPVENSRALLESPAVGSAMMLNLTQEMTCLKSMVTDLVRKANHQSAPNVPKELYEYYEQLIQNQIADELASEMIGVLQKTLRPEHLSQSLFVREKLAEQVEKMIPTAGGINRTKTVGPHVVALIGPTGVGKTTTIAKLAANLKLREKHRVGLITLDTYRIAAIDQLRKYAEIIGSPLRVANTQDELREAISALQDCEYILIDTAGRSPNDAMKLNELRGLIDAAAPDEVHLVISTTAAPASIQLAIDRFSDVRTDKIIFTKLDEAAHVGVVLNVIRKVNKSLSYVTTGQDVPNDIEVGRGRKLAQLILGTKPTE